jgi:hypothetical protein
MPMRRVATTAGLVTSGASLAIAICLLGWAVPAAAPERIDAPRLRPTAGATTYVIGAAGDIACGNRPYAAPGAHACRFDGTAALLFGLDAVLALGDNQYSTGDADAFARFYGGTWGAFKDRTYPVPGNHEYAQDARATPDGYFRYFGDRVRGPEGLGYYSVDLPPGCTPRSGTCWHLIALSSELCFSAGGCGPAADPSGMGSGNRMYAWLRRDLAAHVAGDYPCTLAFWHHPLFSFAGESGSTPATRPLWDELYRAGADVVLNGHTHNYQRWGPQDPSGRYSHHGIREFVVGTGGASKYPLLTGDRPANLVAAQDGSFGILRISLRPSSYSWMWVTASGQPPFADAGSATCRATPRHPHDRRSA